MAKEINTNRYIEPAKMFLGDYMQKWLDHVAIKVRVSTHESYVWASEHIVKGLGSIPLDKLKPLHIQDHLRTSMKSNLSSTSVRYQYNILREALTQAVRWQMIPANPCGAVDPPRKEKYQAKVYTPEQLKSLLEAVKEIPTSIFLSYWLLPADCVVVKCAESAGRMSILTNASSLS